MLQQHVGEAADVLVQLAIADVPVAAWLVAGPEDCRLLGLVGQMAVDAVVGDVELAVAEPRHLALLELPVHHLREGRKEVEQLRLPRPEPRTIAERFAVERFVMRPRRDARALLNMTLGSDDAIGHGSILLEDCGREDVE